MRLCWPDLLDALEERTRRCALVVETGSSEPVHAQDLQADGPIPEELVLRTRLLLAETQRLEALAARRIRLTATAQHYGQT